MILAIAFDFGGTLFSTAKMGAFTPSMTETFVAGIVRGMNCSQEFGERVFEAYVKAWKSRRTRSGGIPERELSSLVLLRSALDEVGGDLTEEQMVETLNSFHSKESELFTPLPYVLETLPKLTARNYRLCIVSNNPWSESIRASLRRYDIERSFEHVIVSCDIGFRKPHRRIFEELLERLDTQPSEILFVGDSFTHDIETPKVLGMKTCLVDFEGADKNSQSDRAGDADLYLTRFDHLLHALAEIK